MTTENHHRLIQDCKRGDKKAQCLLYGKYYKAMFNTALRILNDRQEAEDVMQEAFITAFQKLDQYNGASSFGTWLRKIVINRALDALRRRKELMVSLEDERLEIADDDDTTNDINLLVLKAELVKQQLYRLPSNHRIMLSLHLIEGLDHEEIATILDISYGAVRVRYSRARKLLIERLRQHAFPLLNN